MDGGRFRARRLVPELRWQPAAVDRNRLDSLFDSASAMGADRLRSAPRLVAQASGLTGRSRRRDSGLSARPRPANCTARPRWATSSPSPTACSRASALQDGRPGWLRNGAGARFAGSYFLTQINRPISAVTVNPNSSPILLLRENLGQIESRGLSLDFGLAPRRWLAVDGGYQYAHATVTRGAIDLGNWIPEVARNMATLNVRAFKPRLGTLSLQSRLSGRQFDDDANANMLHGYLQAGRVWLARLRLAAGVLRRRREPVRPRRSKWPRRRPRRWSCGEWRARE